MIISASRRTDLPAFYSEWFFNRLRAGYACVRNPMNPHRVTQVPLTPEAVQGIVFWTKNPAPMLNRLDQLEKFLYYFQFTLTPYGRDMEPNLPPKREVLIPLFQELVHRAGRERVVWRYDPILLNEKYTLEHHVKCFEEFAERLAGFTEKCTISFVDLYQSTRRNTAPFHIVPPDLIQQQELAGRFAEIASKMGLILDACAEEADLSRFGVERARCVDGERFRRLGAAELDTRKDKNQRPACGCMASVDIGAYHTCPNGCRYCYANTGVNRALKSHANHNPNSPFLLGELGEGDVVTAKEEPNHHQLQLF